MAAAAVIFRCEGVLFDMDGVLVETTPSVRRSWQRWADRHGFEAAAVLREAHGRPTVETVALLAPGLDAAAEAQAIEAGQAADGNGVEEGPGAAALIARLPQERWAVVTSATERLARARFRQVGLSEPSRLVTIDDVAAGKPAPDCYLLGAERLGLRPASCVAIEDAPAGIRAAKAAGMRVIALTTTHPEEDLGDADHLLAGMGSIGVQSFAHELELALPVS